MTGMYVNSTWYYRLPFENIVTKANNKFSGISKQMTGGTNSFENLSFQVVFRGPPTPIP